MPITLTHCLACHALLNPSWGECFVCGRHVNELEQTAKREGERQGTAAMPELDMDLEAFEGEGRPLEIRVPWLDLPLWFAPSTTDAAGLVKEGVSRGRIWTAQELRDLLAIPGLTAERVRTVATAKAGFGGTVTA